MSGDEFAERYFPHREARQTFSVKVKGSKLRVTVVSEYYRIDERTGSLVFRNSVRGTYPQTVQVFAPGYWLDLKVVEPT